MKKRFSARVTQVLATTGLPATLAVRAATADAPAEILLYDEIGWYGVTAKDFMTAMASAGAGPLKVRINSPGGDVFDGLAIYNALKAHPGGVTTVVDGLAASAASFIALAGSRMEMAPNTMLMIHRAWGMAIGNTNDMASTAALLAKIDGQIVGMYAAKTGGDQAEILAAVDAETWMTADEAIAAGYCDGLVAAPQDSKSARAMARPALRAALRAAYDPDGDGDDDAAEAVTLIQKALGNLTDAIEALTGTEPDDADAQAAADALVVARQKFDLRARLAMADDF